MLKNPLCSLAVGLALVAGPAFISQARAQAAAKPLVWIDAANPYSNYLEAAVLKKHTPVEFTTLKDKAQYVAALEGTDRKGSAVRAIFLGAAGSGAMSALSLTVSDVSTGVVIFAYTCHKSGEESRGFQSASECLAKHWANFIKDGKP